MLIELQLLWAAVLAYVASGSIAVAAAVMGRRPDRTVFGLIAGGLAVHLAAIVLRWARLGHGPFVTMFEILSSNVWSLLAVFALACWRIPAIRPTAAVVMPVLFVMMGWLMTVSPGEGHLPPTYHTVWLYVHVAMGKVFLGSVLVAVGLAGIVLLRRVPAGHAAFARLPADDRLDDLGHRFLALGLVFETLMLVSGAIWAQDAWGRYWDWDPLETWAFLTWLMLVFALHARRTAGTQPAVGAVMTIGVFVLAFLTFFGVPFVTVAPHQGAI